jgi:integrase/recombinase XerD
MESVMLEHYFVKPSTIDKIRGSWLSSQIESYVEWMEVHGYARPTVLRRVPLLFHFAEFAQKRGCTEIASATAFVEEFVSLWLSQHGAKAKTTESLRKHRIFNESTVLQMLRLACEGHTMRNRHRRPFPLASAVPGFAEYLRCERGFKEITIYAYRRHLNEFAEYLSRAGVISFSELSPPLLAAFIVERAPGMAAAPVAISVVIYGCYCGSATVRGLRTGISAERLECHKYIVWTMCLVPSPGTKFAAC